jgi:rRNA maturation endonuclease Nob1
MKWTSCHECGEEFRIITESYDRPTFCPMCGHDLEDEDELLLSEEWEE